MTITYLPRSQWGGGPIKSGYTVPKTQFVGLVAHHTVSVMPDYDMDQITNGDLEDAAQYMRFLQTARPDLGPEVPYSFNLFEGTTDNDCIVAEGRGLGVTGAHTSGYNSTRYGVAIVGNTNEMKMTPGLIEGFKWVGRLLSDPVHAQSTFGHRDVKNTACPGNNCYSELWMVQPPFNPSQGDWLTMATEEDVKKAMREVLEETIAGGQWPQRCLIFEKDTTGVVWACNFLAGIRINLTGDDFAISQFEAMGYLRKKDGNFYSAGPETLQYLEIKAKIP